MGCLFICCEFFQRAFLTHHLSHSKLLKSWQQIFVEWINEWFPAPLPEPISEQPIHGALSFLWSSKGLICLSHLSQLTIEAMTIDIAMDRQVSSQLNCKLFYRRENIHKPVFHHRAFTRATYIKKTLINSSWISTNFS